MQPWGLRDDRRWLVIDDSGRFVSQRTCPVMATVEACATEDGVTLSAPGVRPLHVAFPPQDAPLAMVSIWRDQVMARLADGTSRAWLGGVLGRSCRLVHMHDPVARPTDPAYAPAGSTVSFADAFPVLATSSSSLEDLNGRLATPVGMDRFRTNLVLEGFPAWAEDGWELLRIGPVRFRAVKPCGRCIVTTIDQRTGLRPDRVEPLAALARFRGRASGTIVFGQNLVPDAMGTVSVGDRVEVIT